MLILTDHAKEQLTHRWPQWDEKLLNQYISKGKGWKEKNGEIHIYLGTGFDRFVDSTLKIRKIYERRHLFAVLKNSQNNQIMITAVFHTTKAAITRAKQATEVWNDTLDKKYLNDQFVKPFRIDGVTWYIDTRHITSIRKERFMDSEDLKLYITSLH